MKVKRLSDGKIIAVPEGHFALSDDRFEVVKPKAKRKPKVKVNDASSSTSSN